MPGFFSPARYEAGEGELCAIAHAEAEALQAPCQAPAPFGVLARACVVRMGAGSCPRARGGLLPPC